MGVSINGGTQQPLVFLLKMIILGCFWGTTILGNTHIYINMLHVFSVTVVYNCFFKKSEGFFFDPCQSFIVETSQIFLLQTLSPLGSLPETSWISLPISLIFAAMFCLCEKKELQYHLEMLIETQLARNFWCNNSIFSNWPKSLWKQIVKKCPLPILKDACLKMRYPVPKSISFVPNMNQPHRDLGEAIEEWKTSKLQNWKNYCASWAEAVPWKPSIHSSKFAMVVDVQFSSIFHIFSRKTLRTLLTFSTVIHQPFFFTAAPRCTIAADYAIA